MGMTPIRPTTGTGSAVPTENKAGSGDEKVNKGGITVAAGEQTGIAHIDDKGLMSSAAGLGAAGDETAAEAGLRERAMMENLPDLSPEGQAFVASLSPEQREALAGIVGLYTAQAKQSAGNVNTGPLQNRWSDFIGDISANGNPVDVNALVQFVLRQAYMQNTEDLAMYAEKVKFFNEQKKQIRGFIKDVRDYKLGLEETLRAKYGPTLPPTSFPEGSGLSMETYLQDCADYYANNKHPISSIGAANQAQFANAAEAFRQLDGILDEAAMSRGAEEVVANANAVYKERFGVELPSQIQEMMTELLRAGCEAEPGDMTKVNQALSMFAAYVSYCSDCNVQPPDGKFGRGINGGSGGDGWDDHNAYNGATEASFEDFLHYIGEDNAKTYLGEENYNGLTAAQKAAATSSTSTNAGARTNLAQGDRETIAAAFGMPLTDLTGNGLEDVVNSAMNSNNATWKNKVLHNADISKADLLAQIQSEGILSTDAQKIFENLGGSQVNQAFDAIRNALQVTPGGSTMSEEARIALGLPDQVPPQGVTTPDELDNLLETWDETLQTVGEDAQLANVDMQNMLQKQQQTMQMMSQISKMLHDTAMAVIRKMGG